MMSAIPQAVNGTNPFPHGNPTPSTNIRKGIHFVRQSREMSKELYLSLPEETKIEMIGRQFYISGTAYPKIERWIHNRTSHPYRIEREMDNITNRLKYWVLFYSEEDAILFKMECESEDGIEYED